jgi:MFS family permease
MNVTNDDAVQSLAQVEQTIVRTRKAVAAAYTSPLLILWGLLWVAAYTTTHFYPKYAGVIFGVMAGVGLLGSFLVWPRVKRNLPVKGPVEEKMNLRVGALWGALFIYIFIWLNILAPVNGMQLNAFVCTAVMFAYVITGLWFTAYFMVWLGLAVTAVTLVGFYFLPAYYCLWMAVTAGGLLLGTGLYIHVRWR